MLTHTVTFLSPGTLFSEQTTTEIASRDPAMACKMAQDVRERHGARPYAFYFTTKSSESGNKPLISGTYYVGGKILDVEAATQVYGADSALADNMVRNWPLVCETANGYNHVGPFEEDDVVVDANGTVIERGDTPERIAYRSAVLGA